MPRKNRVWYPGAVYHIMCRGNHRHDIFRDEEDRLFYLATLKEVKEKIPYLLHSYCLMTNHVHLQIETVDINISQVMKRINMLYAIYFNKKYKFVGHLFQDRYNAELIETTPYHLEISRYIHLNPVRASMVARPEEYKWSSYKIYIEEHQDQLVTTAKTLGCFSPPRVRHYRGFVEEVLKYIKVKPKVDETDGHSY
ncbi:transposase [Desulfoscipio gibsoniae]|uniref:Transposase n=1 Tax=Desulfoscipio gibsoniae DSM 7213 TaxID=767817 RepID=R4KKF0_9FIRM|nr:transposase [Desulfoscipio gibsoniae]AGL03693.1 transposase [Desulfoscipio gibsoniae DSM 7213]